MLATLLSARISADSAVNAALAAALIHGSLSRNAAEELRAAPRGRA